MKPTFSSEEHRSRLFHRVARVVFEMWQEDFGYGHTRLLDRPLIPDELVLVGRSLKGVIEGEHRREHVVPLILLRDRYVDMFKAGASVEEVAKFLERYIKIVLIAKDEKEQLDHKLGLKTEMPNGWWFDDPAADVFARLRKAEIEWD